jgi:low molecular weight protein-tyrosine phosphatase
MASILVVCTGNVCRSPIAEGMLGAALVRRVGDDAPEVRSAGTIGWEGTGAMPESIEAAAERGIDIRAHVARRLTPAFLDHTDLILAMAQEHREEIDRLRPEVSERTFTLKELTRLVEELPEPSDRDLTARVRAASALRGTGFEGNELDEDVSDPLGLPLESYRAIAWELDAWIERLADGLYGPVPAPTRAGGRA